MIYLILNIIIIFHFRRFFFKYPLFISDHVNFDELSDADKTRVAIGTAFHALEGVDDEDVQLWRRISRRIRRIEILRSGIQILFHPRTTTTFFNQALDLNRE